MYRSLIITLSISLVCCLNNNTNAMDSNKPIKVEHVNSINITNEFGSHIKPNAVGLRSKPNKVGSSIDTNEVGSRSEPNEVRSCNEPNVFGQRSCTNVNNNINTDNINAIDSITSIYAKDLKYINNILKSIGNNDKNNTKEQIEFIKTLSKNILDKKNNNKSFSEILKDDKLLANGLSYYQFVPNNTISGDKVFTEYDSLVSKIFYDNLLNFIKNCYDNNKINKNEYKSILQYMLYNNTADLVSILFNRFAEKNDGYSKKGIYNFIQWFKNKYGFDRTDHNAMYLIQNIINKLVDLEYIPCYKDIKFNNSKQFEIDEKIWKLKGKKIYNEIYKKIILQAFKDQLHDETNFFDTMFHTDTMFHAKANERASVGIKTYLTNDTKLQLKLSRIMLPTLAKPNNNHQINYLNKELNILTEPNQAKQTHNIIANKIKNKYMAKNIFDYIPQNYRYKLIAGFRNDKINNDNLKNPYINDINKVNKK